jgi:flagellar hook-basal body complex protein FliE
MRISSTPMMRPESLRPPPKLTSPFVTPSPPTATGNPFAELLFRQVDQVNTMQTSAENSMQSLLTGGDVNEAEVLTAVQKADLAFRLLLQVRNKLLEAYREVQQIQF